MTGLAVVSWQLLAAGRRLLADCGQGFAIIFHTLLNDGAVTRQRDCHQNCQRDCHREKRSIKKGDGAILLIVTVSVTTGGY